MIYHQKYLPVKILFESCDDKPIRGVYRPQAYVNGKSYCTECQIDNVKEVINTGDKVVLDVLLLAPVGYGHNLVEGALLNLKDGVRLVGKAIVLEIKRSKE